MRDAPPDAVTEPGCDGHGPGSGRCTYSVQLRRSLPPGRSHANQSTLPAGVAEKLGHVGPGVGVGVGVALAAGVVTTGAGAGAGATAGVSSCGTQASVKVPSALV